MRTASDQPHRMQKLKLCLFCASDIAKPKMEVAKERIKQVITRAGEKDFPDVSLDPLPIETILASTSFIGCILPNQLVAIKIARISRSDGCDQQDSSESFQFHQLSSV